jgi:hypothetical protein
LSPEDFAGRVCAREFRAFAGSMQKESRVHIDRNTRVCAATSARKQIHPPRFRFRCHMSIVKQPVCGCNMPNEKARSTLMLRASSVSSRDRLDPSTQRGAGSLAGGVSEGGIVAVSPPAPGVVVVESSAGGGIVLGSVVVVGGVVVVSAGGVAPS